MVFIYLFVFSMVGTTASVLAEPMGATATGKSTQWRPVQLPQLVDKKIKSTLGMKVWWWCTDIVMTNTEGVSTQSSILLNNRWCCLDKIDEILFLMCGATSKGENRKYKGPVILVVTFIVYLATILTSHSVSSQQNMYNVIFFIFYSNCWQLQNNFVIKVYVSVAIPNSTTRECLHDFVGKLH